MIITKGRVPSFVVTLAGYLTWGGVVLILTTEASSAGTIRIQDDVALGIANNYLPDVWGWALLGALLVAYLLLELAKVRARRERGVAHRPLVLILLQLVAIGSSARWRSGTRTRIAAFRSWP